MIALKALADTNLKVSEARNSLNKLQEQETEYLVSREKKAMDRIQGAFDTSKDLLEQTNKNYELIEDFAKSVAGGATFLEEATTAFQALVEAKETHYTLWEKDIKNQEETIESLMKGLKIKEKDIESGKSSLEARNKKLQEDIRKFNDEKGTVERKIKRLKEGRI